MSALAEELLSRPRPVAPRVARAIRLEAGASQVQVALQLGVHPVTVARWEAGTRKPTGETLRRYLELLDELREVTR